MLTTGGTATDRTGSTAGRRRLALGAGALIYLCGSLAMYAHVLALGISRGTTCACSDTSLFTWFFEWPYVALTHGHNPFFSTAMFHPQGINLLSNTSVTALSFLLLPVTALFGPLTSLNVALLIAPVASGVAAMWVAQRWVRSSLAAGLVGALYAFSPLVLFQAAGAHLQLTFLVVPPLVLACLDELFWRKERSAVTVGVALGLLLVVQFFSGTELLVMVLAASAVSLAVLLAAAVVTDRGAATASLRHGLPGLATAAGVSVVLLAWPAYYALHGPGHFVGPIWPGISPADASLRSYLVAVPGTILWWVPNWGRLMRPTYLGPVLAVTLVAGVVVFRRSRRLIAAATVTAVVAWLALGGHYVFSAWHYARHLPLLDDVMNERFSALLFLPAGLALALVFERVRALRRGAAGAVLAVALGAACVAPFAVNASHGLPYSASRVWEPLWYQRNADSLPPGQVILGFPFFTTSADLLAVQALHAMHYSIVGGTGPGWIDARQGPAEPGYRVVKDLASAALAPQLAPTASPAQRTALRTALRYWGATLVVVPFARGPNTSVVARSPAAIRVWLESALGPPTVRDAAWVWTLVTAHAAAGAGGTSSSAPRTRPSHPSSATATARGSDGPRRT